MNPTATRLLLVGLALTLVCYALPADADVPVDEVKLQIEEAKLTGPFANRTGANRSRALQKYGSNARAEKAVEDGLRWLALHQAADGHWGLNDFNKHARTEPLPRGKVVGDDSVPNTARRNDVAGTAFALLPFLAAGHVHQAPRNQTKGTSYQVTVEQGLKWMLAKQVTQGNDRGRFDADTYTHALATMAVCEAYAMTGEVKLKGPAQIAVDYLVRVQHDGGGWRYAPKQAGDTSVTGFVARALVVARAAGLNVPRNTFAAIGKYLDAAEMNEKGTYAYVPGSSGTPAMTAAGALCRLLLGADQRGASLLGSVKKLEATPPSANRGIYYEYYATRVMFEVGGQNWRDWNEGKGKDGMRDVLLKRQDDGAKVKGNKGTWTGTDHETGGRLGATSMSLLTLQVYVRYVPLRDLK